jgi:hypothetical protein
MKRKMFQKVMAAVLCAGLAVPTAVQPLTVTAFADDTAVESTAQSDATEEAASDEAVTDEAAADQTNEIAESTETEAQTDVDQPETGTATVDSATAQDTDSASADSTTSTDPGTELIRGTVDYTGVMEADKSFYLDLGDAYIPNVEDVYFAIWSARDGQDDIRWYKADEVWDDQNNPNLKIYLTEYISLLDFPQKVDGLYDGVWNVHVYAKLKDGTMEFINSMQFTKEKSNMYNMYRLYNPNSGEHFFTQNADERDHLVSVGWRYEGIAWKAPEDGSPVYRLYNPNAGDHHYTTEEDERDMLVSKGWKYEGVAWLSDYYMGTPIYRVYNPNNGGKAGAHFYTKRRTEKDYLVSLGWKSEDIGWYGAFDGS